MSILVADMHKHKRVVTSAPNLKCRHIVHIDVVFYMKSNDWKKAYTAVLQETEKRGFSSLAVPALGTGKRERFLLLLDLFVTTISIIIIIFHIIVFSYLNT